MGFEGAKRDNAEEEQPQGTGSLEKYSRSHSVFQVLRGIRIIQVGLIASAFLKCAVKQTFNRMTAYYGAVYQTPALTLKCNRPTGAKASHAERMDAG